MRWLLALLLTAVCLQATGAGVSQGLAAELAVPPLSGRVVDLAGMLSPQARQRVEALSAALERSDSTQVVVLTIPSLQGQVLEEYAVKVASAWGLGQKGQDNGVLLLVAKAERKVRIEVGYGLEGRLTDLLAGRIVDRIITPRFKAGDFDGGVVAGAEAIAQAVKGEFQAKARDASRTAQGDGLFGWGLFMLVLVALPFVAGNRWLTGGLGALVTSLLGLEFLWPRLLLMPVYAALGFGIGYVLTTYRGGPRPPSPPGGPFSSTGGWGRQGWNRGAGGIFLPGGFGGWSGGGGGGGSSGVGGGGGGFGGGGASGDW